MFCRTLGQVCGKPAQMRDHEPTTSLGGSMKGQIARTLTIVSVAVWLFAGAAYGQYVQQIIKVNAPFEFNVYDKTLPAGDYSAVFVAPNRIYLQDSHGRTLT